ncbi:hypothetical protein TS85_22030 [Sphingomonas hengshuiensis]|uniref:Endonuclease/exonuclease/phosphatase domain-containing protein n=1 Tax=Sphingomonas hengshuiensis TaxID=1609977 RepID=A0A7U4JBR2_9SPHN|nr:hypothetical protein TS85_22030 [Sphingomonas hengshuiensis]
MILAWYLAFTAFGDRPPYLGYVNAFGFWLGLGALLAGVALAIARAWLAAAGAVALALVVLSHGGVALHRGRDAPPASGTARVRLVTASLRSLNDDMEDAARMLLSFRPDIIAVQEADPGPLLAALDRRSGGRWQMARLRNEAVLCRCPVEGAAGDAKVLRATARLASGPLTIWSVHAPKSYGRPLELLRFSDALRADMLAHQPGIVAGDLNATPWNDGYRALADSYSDAWLKAGSGPGFTFPSRARRAGWLFPYLRLDYVLASPTLDPVRASTGVASHGADHLPLVVEFAVPHHAATEAAMLSR